MNIHKNNSLMISDCTCQILLTIVHKFMNYLIKKQLLWKKALIQIGNNYIAHLFTIRQGLQWKHA